MRTGLSKGELGCAVQLACSHWLLMVCSYACKSIHNGELLGLPVLKREGLNKP